MNSCKRKVPSQSAISLPLIQAKTLANAYNQLVCLPTLFSFSFQASNNLFQLKPLGQYAPNDCLLHTAQLLNMLCRPITKIIRNINSTNLLCDFKRKYVRRRASIHSSNSHHTHIFVQMDFEKGSGRCTGKKMLATVKGAVKMQRI